MIQGISHVTFIAQDIEKTARLLVSVLGAQEVYDSGEKTFSLSCEKFFLLGGTWVVVMQGPPSVERTYRHVAFHVSGPLARYAQALKAMGIEPFPGRARVEGEGDSLYFYDFDNQLIELHTGTLSERLNAYRDQRSSGDVSRHPPRPEGWKLTLADLMNEIETGKRESLEPHELDWARDYERSLIPETMRFPRKGDVYEALQDMEVDFMTAWAAPFTGGGKAVMRKGDRVLVESEPSDPRPIGSYAEAMEYRALEERMVPKSDRNAPGYGGFYFYFSTVDLNTKFVLVRTGYEKRE